MSLPVLDNRDYKILQLIGNCIALCVVLLWLFKFRQVPLKLLVLVWSKRGTEALNFITNLVVNTKSGILIWGLLDITMTLLGVKRTGVLTAGD